MSKAPDRKNIAAKNKKSSASAAKRESAIRMTFIGVIAAVVLGVIVYGIVGGSSSVDDSPAPTGTIPTFVEQSDLSWSPNPDSTAASTLEIWEDFQCPYCAIYEGVFSSTFERLADEGHVVIKYRPTTFLDGRFAGRHSARATNAFACAIDQGVGEEFHKTLFLNQPTEEGDGWTDAELVEIGVQSGVTEANKADFETCVAEGTYYKWGVDSTALFDAEGIPGTPNYRLDGVEVPADVMTGGPEALYNWVIENKK